MKKLSSALMNLLNTADSLCLVDLLTITLTNGTTFYYSAGDYNINVGGVSYVPNAFDVGKIKQALGVSVDDLKLDWFFDQTDSVLGGLTIPEAINSGAFDYAIVILQHVFMTSWEFVVSSDYALLDFVGMMEADTAGRTKADITVKSITNLLNVQLPRNIYQPGCINLLFDSNSCCLNRAAYTLASSVGTGSSQSVLNCGLSNAAGYLNQGSILFTSGANNGVIATIQSSAPGQINLMWPLPFMPATGDTFTAVPGCDRSMNTCNSKFNNLIHYRGTPFIPVPESVT